MNYFHEEHNEIFFKYTVIAQIVTTLIGYNTMQPWIPKSFLPFSGKILL